MKGKRPLTVLIALALFASVLAVGPVAAQDYCDQSNQQVNVGNLNTDLNVNAVNAAANVPIASPNDGGSQYADASQTINDGGDSFQSQSNTCD